MLRKNTAGQFLHFAGVNATTGAALSGLTWTVRRCLDGTFAAATGTVSEDTGLGFYKFALSQADTNGNNCAIFATATGAVPVCLTFITTACDPTSVAFGLTIAKTTNITGFNDVSTADVNAQCDTAILDVGLTTTITGRIDAAVSTRLASASYTAPDNASIAAILVDTAEIGVAGAGLTNINLPDQTMNITGDITGSLSGSVGSVTGAVGSVTGLTASNLDTTVSSRLATAGYTAPDNSTIAAIAGFVDTEVTAIKAQTDQMVFTKAGELDVNTLSINGVTIAGNGTTEPMRAA